VFKIIVYRLDSTVVSINNESLDAAVKIRNDDSNVSTPIADNSTVSANDERKKRRPAPPPPRPPSATFDVLSNILNSINLSLFQQTSNNNTITDSQQQLIDGSQHFMSPSGEAMEILEDLYDVLNNQENADRQYPVFAEREFGQTLCN